MLIPINREIAERLSATELAIVRFINEHEKKFSELSILDIAAETYSSPATVSRAIKKCNISGFSELRFRSVQAERAAPYYQANEILLHSLDEAQSVIESISVSQLMQVSKFIKTAEKIYVLGRGLSEYVAEEFSLKLQLLGMDSMFIHDPNIMRLKTQQMRRQDLLINFTLNGSTAEILESAANSRANGSGIVTICCNPDSELINLSDISLIGYSHPVSAITQYEVRSRLPLHIMSRMITECLAASI